MKQNTPTEITIIHDQQNGVIKLKINGENARSPWVYGDSEFNKKIYLEFARMAAYNECCAHSILNGSVKLTEHAF